MIDEELTAALKDFCKFRWESLYAPDRKELPTLSERFREKFGEERGPMLLTRISALQREANQVPDPGGPIGNYIDNMRAWEKTHPEVDPHEIGALTYPMIVMASH